MSDKIDFSATWKMFFATCPGCHKPIEEGEDTHESGTGLTWHTACFSEWNKRDKSQDPPGLTPSPPAYGDYEGTGWVDEYEK